MALDYLTIGVSFLIFLFYLTIFLLLIEIKKKLNRDAGRAFIYIMISLFFLIIRRLQQIFIYSNILNPIYYSTDIITLLFTIFFFLGIFSFYRSLKKAGGQRRNISESFSNYKRKLERKIIR